MFVCINNCHLSLLNNFYSIFSMINNSNLILQKYLDRWTPVWNAHQKFDQFVKILKHANLYLALQTCLQAYLLNKSTWSENIFFLFYCFNFEASSVSYCFYYLINHIAFNCWKISVESHHFWKLSRKTELDRLLYIPRILISTPPISSAIPPSHMLSHRRRS